MTEHKGCPFCGHQPEAREIVEGKVWGMNCAEPYRISHSFSVMSWTSAEHCAKLWNTRHGDKE